MKTHIVKHRHLKALTFIDVMIVLTASVMVFGPETRAAWTAEIHNRAGNLGLADGSVCQATDYSLQRQLQTDTNAVIRLAIPLTK